MGRNAIGDEGTAALSEALKSNNTLETLVLTSNNIRAAGAQSLADMLQVNRALTALDVQGNKLGDGSGALADAVSESQQIEVFCKIPVKQLRDDSLTELNLRGESIGPCGAMVVAHLLHFSRALTSVNLLQNDLGDGAAAVVAAAKQHGNIKTLCGIEQGRAEVSFKNRGLEASDAVLLSFDMEVNRALKSVDLWYNNIPDEAKQQLRAAAAGKSITLKYHNTL